MAGRLPVKEDDEMIIFKIDREAEKEIGIK